MNNTFTDTLWKVEKMLDEASQRAANIQALCNYGEVREAYRESFNLTRLAERIALHTRKLPVYTGHPQAALQTKYIITEESNIKIGYTEEGWFSIRLPLLLPKKNSDDADFLKEMLYPMVGRFITEHRTTGRIYGPVILIFRHVYSENFPERMRRDHDNVEVKALADIVTLSLLIDDAPAYCSHYYCSGVGDEERTEVYVIHQDEFITWLTKEKTMPKEGVTLHVMEKKT